MADRFRGRFLRLLGAVKPFSSVKDSSEHFWDSLSPFLVLKMPPREKEVRNSKVSFVDSVFLTMRRSVFQFDAVVLVVDVCRSASASGFLDSGVRCASELLQRKLFSEAPDRFGLVMVGTDKDDNPLGYPGVTLVADRGLAVADWQLLDFVQNHVQGKFNFATCFDLRLAEKNIVLFFSNLNLN